MSEKEALIIPLKGRIDSANAQDIEKDILSRTEEKPGADVILDVSGLEYISSAGLRVILRLKKLCPSLRLENASSEVYEILEMTGFTEIIPVCKAYRTVSIEGAEEIGRGANGTIYRVDKDNVVKVYNDANALDAIHHEREMAKLALILGVPTAISYDVVKVGDSYGSVFELLNAQSFSNILATDPSKFDFCVNEFVSLLKKIHSIEAPHGKLPDMKDKMLSRAEFLLPHLPEESGKKLYSLINAVPRTDTLIHGDYHTKNVELQNNEVLLIDMDTLSVGHPVFEFGLMFNSFIGFYEYDHSRTKDYHGFDFETGKAFWRGVLSSYLGTNDPALINAAEDKARILGHASALRRAIRRGLDKTPSQREETAIWKGRLIELIKKTDSLLMNMNELETEACDDNLSHVISFIEEKLDKASCPTKIKMQICVAAEEIFVNVAHYAYAPSKGKIKICADTERDGIVLTFIDSGVPFDPLLKQDPDLTLSADERREGGLGIYMVKKTMDDVRYERKDGKNILSFRKKF